MFAQSNTATASWLAFELNVLRRLKFETAILPFTDQPQLGAYLKRWNVRVAANDPTLAGWTKAVAAIQNNSEKLSDADVNLVLEDAYVPGYRLQNHALRRRFGESDAWWFDNVRRNAERLASPVARAIALSVGLSVGDYALSFTDQTLELRQPLSAVYRKLLSVLPEPFNNGHSNPCQNKAADDFIGENYPDLMFLRLPAPRRQSENRHFGGSRWREEWLRGGDEFWSDSEKSQIGRLGTVVETKSQYLHLVENALRTASEIPKWVVAHVEDGFISTPEIVETVGRVRRVDTIFTKDFSELTGTKAVIITA